jgi:hypothetical protein
MTRRMVFDSSGFKVSKPGYDVLTAGPANLQFSSDFGQLAHFQTGELDCNWNESPFRTYSFAKTFPSPPIVHLQQVNASNDVWEAGAAGHLYWEFRQTYTDLGGTTYYPLHVVNAYVTASAIMIQSLYTDSPAIHPPLYRLRYTVMDYNL